MSLEIPESAIDVENRAKTDVQRELPESNPFLKNSWLLALVTAFSNRIFDFYLQLKIAIRENFPDTATKNFLERWAAIWGKQRLPATQSKGNVVATGTAGAVIAKDTIISIDKNDYHSTSSTTISDHSINVKSIERSGQVATVTTVSDHNLANNVKITISGALENEYNVTDSDITVTALNSFEYDISGTPSSPATGTIIALFTSGVVLIKSVKFGKDTDLDSGENLTLQTPLINVDNSLVVDFGGVGGGTDQETDLSLRSRLLDRIQNPVAHFNTSDIVDIAKKVPGVTRVFVQPSGTIIGKRNVSSIVRSGKIATVTLRRAIDISSGQSVSITGANQNDYNIKDAIILVESSKIFHYIVTKNPVSPATGNIKSTISISLGTVVVYFMRDNDTNPIPTASEIKTVKNKILEITPANTSKNDIVVLAPSAIVIDFVFSELVPKTETMKASIIENLKAFFADETDVGINIDEDAYRSAIFNTIDLETGEQMKTFKLSEPKGDIKIGIGKIGVLGNITF